MAESVCAVAGSSTIDSGRVRGWSRGSSRGTGGWAAAVASKVVTLLVLLVNHEQVSILVALRVLVLHPRVVQDHFSPVLHACLESALAGAFQKGSVECASSAVQSRGEKRGGREKDREKRRCGNTGRGCEAEVSNESADRDRSSEDRYLAGGSETAQCKWSIRSNPNDSLHVDDDDV